MLKITYMHKELEKLDFSVKEFNRLVQSNDIRYPAAFKLVIRLFGRFNITLHEQELIY